MTKGLSGERRGWEPAKKYLAEADKNFKEGNYKTACALYANAGMAPDTTVGIWRKGLEGIRKCEEAVDKKDN